MGLQFNLSVRAFSHWKATREDTAYEYLAIYDENMPHLTKEQRKKAIRLHEKGLNARAIAERLEKDDNVTTTRQAVWALIEKYTETGQVDDRKREPVNTKVTEEI